MSRKKTKRKRKKSPNRQKIVYAIYSVLTFLSVYFFFRAYQYISNIPEANNITQEEIYDITKIEESDIKLIRALKNEAFDSWLYEANEDKAKQLPKTQAVVSSVVEGKVKVSEVDQVIGDLKQRIDIINDIDIEELYVLFYKAVLPRQYENADNSFQEMTIEEPEKGYQEMVALLDLLNKIYNQKGMQSVTGTSHFKDSVSLLEEVNSNFYEVNQIKSKYINYDTLMEPIPEPETRLGKELDNYVYKVNDYLESHLKVLEFETKYNELKSNLATGKSLVKKSVEVPDLVGLTVDEAQRKLSKIELNLRVKGYTNKFYRNGEIVPESQRGIEVWDDDKQDKVMQQTPTHLEYDFIMEGSTIEIMVENKSIKQPTESSESSSSPTFESSTTSSSATEESSSDTDTTSSDDEGN